MNDGGVIMADMVTIPRKEYDALVSAAEDLADIRAYDRAKAALKAGDDELVPADVVKRILAGESPLRVWREHRGLTQAALGEAAGVNRVQITTIETGHRTGSVDTVKRLAVALGVSVDDLV